MPHRRADAFAGLWRSHGVRWGVAVAALLGGSLLAMFGLMYWRSSVLLFETLDRSVLEQASLLAARPPEMLPFMISSRMNHQPAVLTRTGLFAADRTPVVGDIAAIPTELVLDRKIHEAVDPGDPASHWRAAGRTLPDGRILVVARASDEILQVRRDLVRGAIAGILPAILLSLGGGALAGIATERRLRALRSVAEQVIAGDLSRRLPVRSGGDELDRLCAIVNRMLERMEEAVGALQGVGENIAHDLRTPLTALRTRLERAMDMAGGETPLAQTIGQSIEGVDRALSIVTALLRIADIEHVRRESAFNWFDLGEIVVEVAEAYQPVAEEKGVGLTCAVLNPAAVRGDRQLLTEALVNLTDNAVKFTPPGGKIRMCLAVTPMGPAITIADTGPGIPPEARQAVFQRFHRGDASRTARGNGLGLSLVAAIAKLHGFSIRLGDAGPGCLAELRCWRAETARGTIGSFAGNSVSTG